MARPIKPKELKPKVAEAEGGAPGKGASEGGGLDIKLIIIMFALTLVNVVGTVGGIYALGQMVLMPALIEQLPKGGAGGEEGHGEEAAAAHKEQAGMNLELDEFTVNLKPDPTLGGSQYLRTKMALSIAVPEAEACHHDEAAGGGEGGHGGGGAAADPCQTAFNQKMGAFVPSVRDIINTSLMKRTANMLSSPEGQEALKDEIKEKTNALMAEGHYKVLRVNFQDFIVQR